MYQENGEHTLGLLYNKQNSLWTTRMSRGQFLSLFGISIGTGLLVACAPKAAKQIIVSPAPTFVSAKEAGFPLESGETGQTLGYGESVTIGGQIEFINKSKLVNPTIAMSRINQQTGVETGLLQLNGLLVVNFVDQPRNADTTGGDTYFDPQTGIGESEIVVPKFVDKLKNETALPNTALTTTNRKNGYLSVILSQAAIVEISNQAHLQRYIGQSVDSNIQGQIDRASNQLGLKYAQQIMAGPIKPFIIVNGVKLSS